jgi:XTP/dITP diphosphohydrolase
MRIMVATRNSGKLLEYRKLLSPLGWEVVSMEEAGVSTDLSENGETFEANALSKARALRCYTGEWVLGDDSGLLVDALGKAPGVRSARYAGEGLTGVLRDEANTAKLLHEMEGVPDEKRTARFVCVIALVDPAGQEIVAHGCCEGMILRTPRGVGGFGYDPVFLPSGFQQTMAELDLEQKNHISHRGMALRDLLRLLNEAAPDQGSGRSQGEQSCHQKP